MTEAIMKSIDWMAGIAGGVVGSIQGGRQQQQGW